MDPSRFREAAASVGLSLSDDQTEAFARFEEALCAANAVMNLTRVAPNETYLRHFIDSLLFHDLLPDGVSVLDVGSGPGFPAWPIACARPDVHVTALDSSGKMLGFLRAQALPNLTCVLERAETWGVREAFDVVTGRAVAPLAIQLELSAAPCRIGGIVVPMRTPADLDVITALDPGVLGLRLRDVVRRVLPVIDAERVFPVYEKVAATPTRFPRSWAEVKRKPLG